MSMELRIRVKVLRKVCIDQIADLCYECTFGERIVAVQAAAMAHPVCDALQGSLNPERLLFDLGFHAGLPSFFKRCV